MTDNFFVRELTHADKKAYEVFTSSQPNALLYHSLPYLEMVSQLAGGDQNTLLAFDSQKNLCGVLPLLSRTASLGTIYNSLPYYGSIGGTLASSKRAEHALFDAYNGLITSSNAAAATLVSNPLLPMPNKSRIAHNITDFRIGQFSTIAHDTDHAEKIMQSCHHKTRNMIRKGTKSGFSISEENNNIDFLEKTHRENMRALNGKAKTQEFFNSIKQYFCPRDDFQIIVARNNNEPVAAILVFYFLDTVEYYMPVCLESYRDKQPISFLIYEIMKEASQRGYKRWNWGGTWPSQEGVHRFKKRWGTEDVNYYYYTQVNNKDIFSSLKEDLIEQYTDFFVLPYQHLSISR